MIRQQPTNQSGRKGTGHACRAPGSRGHGVPPSVVRTNSIVLEDVTIESGTRELVFFCHEHREMLSAKLARLGTLLIMFSTRTRSEEVRVPLNDGCAFSPVVHEGVRRV